MELYCSKKWCIPEHQIRDESHRWVSQNPISRYKGFSCDGVRLYSSYGYQKDDRGIPLKRTSDDVYNKVPEYRGNLSFTYEVGKTYHETGTITLCTTGFHACNHLLDCMSYYPLSEFVPRVYAKVSVWGILDEQDGKLAAEYLRIDKLLTKDQVVAACTGILHNPTCKCSTISETIIRQDPDTTTSYWESLLGLVTTRKFNSCIQ